MAAPKMDTEVAVRVLEARQGDAQIVPNGLQELAGANFPRSQKQRFRADFKAAEEPARADGAQFEGGQTRSLRWVSIRKSEYFFQRFRCRTGLRPGADRL